MNNKLFIFATRNKQFIFREPLCYAELTWRYSPNSQTVTVVVHKVSQKSFPAGAKIKCQCGGRAADTKKHPNIVNDKVEIKVAKKIFECLFYGLSQVSRKQRNFLHF